uniref:Uncharacterized protein n=1 Tax=Arundo donax TaxID=35708 RepID=A0A0A8Z528_ARUDO
MMYLALCLLKLLYSISWAFWVFIYSDVLFITYLEVMSVSLLH